MDSVTRFSTSVFCLSINIPQAPLSPALKYFRIRFKLAELIGNTGYVAIIRYAA
jgi:hypothetical protein